MSIHTCLKCGDDPCVCGHCWKQPLDDWTAEELQRLVTHLQERIWRMHREEVTALERVAEAAGVWNPHSAIRDLQCR